MWVLLSKIVDTNCLSLHSMYKFFCLCIMKTIFLVLFATKYFWFEELNFNSNGSISALH